MILCVCTGNTCRSPMAAALLRRRGMEAQSAGLYAANQPASPEAIAVMAEWGVDLSAHRSRPITAALCAEAETIVAMTPAHAQGVLALGAAPDKLLVWNIPDPFGGTLAAYRRTRDALEQAVEKGFQNE